MDKITTIRQDSFGAAEPEHKTAAFQVRNMSSPADQTRPFEATDLDFVARPRRKSFRNGGRRSVLRPFVGACSCAFLVLVIVWVVPGLIDSREQRTLHRAAVHSDGSATQIGAVATIKTPVTLVYRDVNGTVHRILADEIEANRFVNDTLIYLDSERDRIKVETQQKIATLLETAFADRQEAISRYADWTGTSNGDDPGPF
jgi:hypothetical protein